MDRVIVYDGALPQATDVLNAGKFGLVGQAYQNRAMLGTSTVVSGLACTPSSPTADLRVTVGVGTIYQMDPTDGAAYSDLGVDNNSIMKQGILASPVVLTITPPVTGGFSQVYLVQAILNDVDAGQTVLSYYNSANPASPFSGPANSGTSNFTTRTNPCVIALKAGVPATTGTQATPSPDVGYVGLYAITVANGATQITSPNIVQQPSAPFFPTLPSVPLNVLNSSWTYAGIDTGAANAYVITFGANQAIPASYVTGMTVKFKALNTCTGASTINVNGLGVVTIKRASGTALAASDIISGQMVELTYDGSVFQMVNYLGAAATSNTNTVVGIPYIADSGTTNAIIATFSPAITSGQQVAGLTIEVKLANTITGACTINVNGLGVKSVKTGDLQNPPNAVYVAGEVLFLIYDGTQYQIANSTSLIYRKPSANTTIYVNASTGSDSLYDGTSASVVGGGSSAGPLATIQKAVTVAFGYAPSQFTITISIAASVYNEAVGTPSYAGPNLIIDGGSAASVTVSSGSNSTFVVRGPNTMTVKNVTVQNTGAAGTSCGFFADGGASMVTANTVSNAIAGAVFIGNNLGNCTPGTHTFSGSSQTLFWANGGTVSLGGGAVFTISASISVSLATCYAASSGNIGISATSPPSFVNPSFVSGSKYYAYLNGVLNSGAIGLTGIPGTSSGTTALGGQAI